jgi:hypothetical protein
MMNSIIPHNSAFIIPYTDRVRFAVGCIGFLALLRALSIPFPSHRLEPITRWAGAEDNDE